MPEPKAVTDCPPGSALAQIQACACPVAENGYGMGAKRDFFGERSFIYSPACRMHGHLAKPEQKS